jgi:signal transduction histidine kinase
LDAVVTGTSSLPRARPALVRPREVVLSGTSEALARHLGRAVPVVRWVMAGLALVGGAGILLYLWLWAFTPLEEAERGREAVRRQVPVAWLLFAVCALLAAVVLVFGSAASASGGWAIVGAVTTMVACAVGAVAWEQFVELETAPRAAFASPVQLATGAMLLVTAALEAVVWSPAPPVLWALFALTVVAAVIVLLGPRAIRLWQEVIVERTVRVREEQRAEIAAHLHDSVLQTLALIQNRAGASSEVARIARAQERELRDWLYAGRTDAAPDLAAELREFATVLELDHPVRIEVVAVGETTGRATGEIAAAAREAMLNAARHAGGEVSVYLESTPTTIEVFVRDHGPGFDLDAVADDRLGVRESIVGRMRRAGGSALVAKGADGEGTEIRLRLDQTDGGAA